MLKIKGDYIAAISGGPDSMALLDIYKKNIKCVCHVNYNFRKDSSKDTNIVKKYCLKNRIKLFIKTIKPTIYIDKPFKNFED
jgi:tRNA(Ile)-lysidine synthase